MLGLILSLALCTTPEPTYVVAGGKVTSNVIYEEFLRAAGPNPRIGIVITASKNNVVDYELWHRLGAKEITVVTDTFPTNIDALYIMGGDQQTLAERYRGKKFLNDLIDFSKRGGIIGGSSAGASILSEIMIGGGGANDLILEPGFGLIHKIIDQHFDTRPERLARLKVAVQKTGRVGVGIAENSAILIKGSSFKVIGTGVVTIIRQTRENRYEIIELIAGDVYE